ncbi:MAG: hypothetical protein AAF492_09245 [Verrucomicrobiota bacterium]
MKKLLLTLWLGCLMVEAGGQVTPPAAGLKLWFDASDAATLTFESNNLVRAWADKSTNRFDAMHLSTNFPLYVTNAIGGQPALRFTGTPLTVTSNLGLSAGQSRTVLMVVRYAVLRINGEILGTGTGSMLDLGNWHPSGTRDDRIRFRNGADNNFSVRGSVPRFTDTVLIARHEVCRLRVERNQVSLVDTSTTAFAWAVGANLQVGGANFGGREYHGDLAELLFYDRVLSTNELNTLRGQLEVKYGLAAPPDPGTGPALSGLEVWLDATELMTNGTTNAFVAQWNDLSGQLHHAAPIGNASPILLGGSINGRPAVAFSQLDNDSMALAGNLGIGLDGDRSVFVVFRYDRLLANNHLLGNSTAEMIDVGRWTPSGLEDERLRLRWSATNLFSSPGEVPLGNNLLTVQADGAGTRVWRNGLSIVDDPIRTFHYALTTAVKVGGVNFPSTTDRRNFDGLIGEVLVYNRVLSPAELNRTGYYLEQKYGLDTLYVRPVAPVGTAIIIR